MAKNIKVLAGYERGRFFVENTLSDTLSGLDDAPMPSSSNVSKFTQLLQDRNEGITTPYYPWGVDNMQPTRIMQAVAKVPLMLQGFGRLAEMNFGAGVRAAKNSALVANRIENVESNEIADFLFESDVASWFYNQSLEYFLFGNAFSECEAENKKNGKIIGLYHQTAEYVRVSVQDPLDFRIKWAIYAPEFQLGRALAEFDKGKAYKAIPLFREYAPRKFVQSVQDGSVSRYFAHTKTNLIGNTYYADTLWAEGLLREGGWYEVAEAAPRIASAMMKKQARIKYLITIPVTYFLLRHPDWNSYDRAKRDKIINDKVASLETRIAGEDNASSSIVSIVEEDEVTGRAIGKILIEPVDDKFKNGAWIPDSSVADLQILNAIGVNPNQFQLANQQGKSMGAGSGSDSRVGFNTHILNNTVHQTAILRPLNWVSRINNWGVTFYIDNPLQTTLNDAPSGVKDTTKDTKNNAKDTNNSPQQTNNQSKSNNNNG